MQRKLDALLANSRFWILSSSIVLSFLIAGFIQLMIPSGPLQVIRIEQWYGFLSMLFLYLAVLASPLSKAFPGVDWGSYKHARRAIGVSAFYYAALHVYLSFFKQLNGFAGIKYLDSRYSLSLLLGVFALAVLFVMTATSLDWAVNTMGFKNWKLLHRLVYFAGLAILVHIALIGPHYAGLGFLSTLTIVAVAFLLWLEGLRLLRAVKAARSPKRKSSK